MGKSMWRRGGTYVFIAELVLGLLMLGGALALQDADASRAGAVVSILCMLLAVMGIIGIAWEFEPILNMHVMGSMVCLSMIMSTGWQGYRNVKTFCALAKLERWDDVMMKSVVEDGHRQQAAFSTMMLRLSAMDLVVEAIHDDPEKGGLPSDAKERLALRPTGKAFQELYFRNVWRVTDAHFIVTKLEHLRQFTSKLLDKLGKDTDGTSAKKTEETKERIRNLVDSTLQLAEEVITRESNSSITPEKYEEAIMDIKWAFQNVTNLMMTAQAMTKRHGPEQLSTPESTPGANDLEKAISDMKITKEALSRLKEDNYESMKLPHMQTVKEGWRKRWAMALVSKINSAVLDEKSYLGKVPMWCHNELEMQKGFRACGMVMMWILAASAYTTFSQAFLLAARKQSGSPIEAMMNMGR